MYKLTVTKKLNDKEVVMLGREATHPLDLVPLAEAFCGTIISEDDWEENQDGDFYFSLGRYTFTMEEV
jgi:hypothetical protein